MIALRMLASTGHAGVVLEWLLILSVFAAIADTISGNLYGRSMCLSCGGRGGHRDDCPRRQG